MDGREGSKNVLCAWCSAQSAQQPSGHWRKREDAQQAVNCTGGTQLSVCIHAAQGDPQEPREWKSGQRERPLRPMLRAECTAAVLALVQAQRRAAGRQLHSKHKTESLHIHCFTGPLEPRGGM